HPVSRRIERISSPAAEQLGTPAQAGIRRVAQSWTLWRAPEVQGAWAPGVAQRHLPIVDAVERDLRVELVPRINVDVARLHAGIQFGGELLFGRTEPQRIVEATRDLAG